jgi:hypothetical protein
MGLEQGIHHVHLKEHLAIFMPEPRVSTIKLWEFHFRK